MATEHIPSASAVHAKEPPEESDLVWFDQQQERVRKWLDEIPDFTHKADFERPKGWVGFANGSSFSSIGVSSVEEWEDPTLLNDLQRSKHGILGGMFCCFIGCRRLSPSEFN